MKNSLKTSTERFLEIATSLNFDSQKRWLSERYDYSQRDLDRLESSYKKFLALKGALKEQSLEDKLIPNEDIDVFWHAHILDTQKYHQDCTQIFGQYLHHRPDYEINATKHDEETAHSPAGKIWSELFDEPLYSKSVPSGCR